ncbi:MAG: hypothetical protein CL840_17515 [Crocinitomicaceae bacterium]|nr:hypothetical protein [Crocinitomicaceae bacterium]
MIQVAEIVGLILFATVKFLFAPSAIMALGYSFWETIAMSLFGGWLGVVFFYYTGSAFFGWLSGFGKKNKPKRKFSKKNRFVIWLKNGFGLNGIAIILGVGSIPLVCLLAAKYFRSDRRTIFYLLTSVAVWGVSLTSLSFLFKGYLLELL